MAGQTTLDFLGGHDLRRARSIAAQHLLDNVEEAVAAEEEMLSAIASAQGGEGGIASRLLKCTESLVFAGELESGGLVANEASLQKEEEELQRQKHRREADRQEFLAARRARKALDFSLPVAPEKRRQHLPGFLKIRRDDKQRCQEEVLLHDEKRPRLEELPKDMVPDKPSEEARGIHEVATGIANL